MQSARPSTASLQPLARAAPDHGAIRRSARPAWPAACPAHERWKPPAWPATGCVRCASPFREPAAIADRVHESAARPVKETRQSARRQSQTSATCPAGAPRTGRAQKHAHAAAAHATPSAANNTPPSAKWRPAPAATATRPQQSKSAADKAKQTDWQRRRQNTAGRSVREYPP